MKTGLQMVKDIYDFINIEDINTVITGNIYQYARPKNSILEDVVVNSLAVTTTQLQQGVANINIHAPNLENLKIKGKNDDTQPNVERLTAIAALIVEKVRDVKGFDFHFNAQSGGLLMRDDQDLTWYINIRIDYYATQTNFVNV